MDAAKNIFPEIFKFGKDKSRYIQKLLLVIVLIVCVLLALVVNVRYRIHIVYTHLFYIPIVMSGIWYHRRALFVAGGLGAVHISCVYVINHSLTSSSLLRAVMFLGIALVVGILSEKRDLLYQELQKINNAMLDMITEVASDGKIDYISPSCINLLGFSPGEMIGTSIFDLVHPEDQAVVKQNFDEANRSGISMRFDYRYRHKDGSYTWFESLANPIMDDSQRLSVYVCGSRDISERKKAEEELRWSKKKFANAFDRNLSMMFIAKIKDDTLIDVNKEFTKVFGYKAEEVIDKSISDLNLLENPEDRQDMLLHITEHGYIKNLEVTFRKKSGETGLALMGVSIFNMAGEDYLLISAIDITQLRRYQNEMARLDRLNLIGKMSAGIAHEIRNPMTTVRGFLQLFEYKERYAEDREHLNLMIEELDRANEIITDFLELSNNKAVDIKPQNLNTKIKELFPLLQADAMKNGINIKLELGEIPDLLLDKGEIRQLLLNLVRNGFEAMSEGGNLTIKTFKDSDGVTLAIQDQGKGISPEVLEKLGVPFFTTKDNGTGLGLAMCYSIADRHNAKIDIETGQEGTIFKVIFSHSRAGKSEP